jgi:hypothetical protein
MARTSTTMAINQTRPDPASDRDLPSDFYDLSAGQVEIVGHM